MSLILQVRADSNNIFRVDHFKNKENWIIHGSPTYENGYPPEGNNDYIYFNTGAWLESPADEIFNLYKKDFTITWWEFNGIANASQESGSIDFAIDTPLNTKNYLLLSYVAAANKYGTCYARNSTASNTSWNIISGMSTGGTLPNSWINIAFTCKYVNNVHTFNTFRNGIKIATATSSNTFPNVGNSGKMFIGAYSGSTSVYGGPNKDIQNIKMYDECLFDGLSNYDVQKFENWDHASSRILSDLKIETSSD